MNEFRDVSTDNAVNRVTIQSTEVIRKKSADFVISTSKNYKRKRNAQLYGLATSSHFTFTLHTKVLQTGKIFIPTFPV